MPRWVTAWFSRNFWIFPPFPFACLRLVGLDASNLWVRVQLRLGDRVARIGGSTLNSNFQMAAGSKEPRPGFLIPNSYSIPGCPEYKYRGRIHSQHQMDRSRGGRTYISSVYRTGSSIYSPPHPSPTRTATPELNSDNATLNPPGPQRSLTACLSGGLSRSIAIGDRRNCRRFD